MEQIVKNKEELKEILAMNDALPEDITQWSVSYNRKVDMVVAGKDFPVGSYYFPVAEGVMLRVDKDKKIYGFAIENASFFVKNHAQFALPLSIVMHPVRFYLFTLPVMFIFYKVQTGMLRIRGMLTISDYIAGRAAFC